MKLKKLSKKTQYQAQQKSNVTPKYEYEVAAHVSYL